MQNIKNEIKAQIARSGYTMTQLVDAINKRYNRATTVQNLSNKLSRGTIQYKEIIEIAEILDYELIWKKKTDN